MKKIFLLVLIIVSITSFSQDSSKLKTSGIILKGKDCDAVGYFIRTDIGNYPDLDSLIKVIYRNPPGNAANVTLDSIPAKQWLRIVRSMKINQICLLQGVYDRVNNELRLHGGSWMVGKLDKDNIVSDAEYSQLKNDGQRFAKKNDDDIN